MMDVSSKKWTYMLAACYRYSLPALVTFLPEVFVAKGFMQELKRVWLLKMCASFYPWGIIIPMSSL